MTCPDLEQQRAEEVAKGALGIDWRDTESAARRVAEHAARLILKLEAAVDELEDELKVQGALNE